MKFVFDSLQAFNSASESSDPGTQSQANGDGSEASSRLTLLSCSPLESSTITAIKLIDWIVCTRV
jgi:hypothetical protein